MTDLIEQMEALAGKHRSEHNEFFAKNRARIIQALRSGQRCADQLRMPIRYTLDDEAEAHEFDRSISNL